jgi:hypothetical protein
MQNAVMLSLGMLNVIIVSRSLCIVMLSFIIQKVVIQNAIMLRVIIMSILLLIVTLSLS